MSHRRPLTVPAVFVLGAGASAVVAQRTVLTANLLDTALTDASAVRELPPADRRRIQHFLEFLSGQWKGVSLLDVLSIVDVATAQNLPLSPDWGTARLARVKRSIQRAIYVCIEESVGPIRMPEAPSRDLAAVLNAIALPGAPLPVIVSLNWDCLIEHAYIAAWSGRMDVIDYGVASVTAMGERTPRADRALVVLKPHGSLSWGYCSLCSLLVSDLTVPSQFWSGRGCPRCSVALSAVLVPPVGRLRGMPPFFDGLWARVEQAIEDSDRLVFIGYSLPSQDVHVRVHVVRALARRALRRRSPMRVEVVTNERAASSGTDVLLERRFRDVVGGHVPASHLHFCHDGFETWCGRQG